MTLSTGLSEPRTRSAAPGVLVVDDQPESLTALQTVLAPLGYDVATAQSGEQALKRLLEDDFGVIVMDVRMPGLDGFETVELIKQRPRHQDTAVIFLTAADADSEQITRGYSAGAIDYVVKPVDPDVLRSKVGVLLVLAEKNAALRESEERFRAAFEGAPIGMGMSTLEGVWLEVNGALCDLVARSPVQLLDQPLWELVEAEDREREREAVERLIRDRHGSHQAEVRLAAGGSDTTHALVSVSVSSDAQDRPVRLLWQVVDVSARRRAATERDARAKAEAVALTLSRLQSVTGAALEHLELQELLEVLVESVREAFGADLARILLCDPERESLLRVGATAGFGDSEAGAPVALTGALDEVVRAARPVTLAELGEGIGLDSALAAERPRALMAAPLILKGRVGGVAEVGVRSERRFSAEDESLLTLMADRAGLAIDHARAYEREVSTVEMLQRSLLPDRLPRIPGGQIAARYLPGGADVGGDWYDAVQLEGGRLGVAMGDVVGHGIGAAALMGQLRHATRAYALEGLSPGVVLDRLDQLVRSLDNGQMATLVYLVVEPDLRSLQLASAGHVPPLVIGPDGRGRFLDTAPDPPLGVFDTGGHTELTAEIEPGSSLVLYTDGLVEERGVSIDAGLEALREAAKDPADAEELCDRLVEAMLAVHPANDDIAVLTLRALPSSPGPFHLELDSSPDNLVTLRRRLGSWLRELGAGGEDVEAVQIACHEAAANAVEHGANAGATAFTVDAGVEDGEVVVVVGDHGAWLERPDGPLPHRGRGLTLMRALMDSVTVTGEGDGTAVRLVRRLACQPVDTCSSTPSNGSATRPSGSGSGARSST
jgi:PAS domain S-box-containing protein